VSTPSTAQVHFHALRCPGVHVTERVVLSEHLVQVCEFTGFGNVVRLGRALLPVV